MAELMAMMGSAAGGTAAAAAPAAAGGTAGGLLGSFAADAPSAMATSLLAPQAATPWVTEAALGGDAFAKFLSPETFGMGAPPAAGGISPMRMALDAMDMMNNEPGGKAPQGMSSRPPGYNPSEPMEQQFARIMGWLQEQGGRR